MPAKKYKILHLDDEETLLRITQDELLAHGYDAYAMDLKRNGFAWILENKPDLVISDIKAPEIDGIEFLRMLRSDPRTRDTKVMILSGVDDLATARETLKLGAVDYMTKPFQFHHLFATIDRILEPGETSADKLEASSQPLFEAAAPKSTILMVAQRNAWAPELVTELAHTGIRVEIAESFEQMLATEFLPKYDLVILTNNEARKGEAMPELVSYLKARHSQMRVLVLSGYANLAIAVDYGRRGADDFLSIPFDLQVVADTVSRILASGKFQRA